MYGLYSLEEWYMSNHKPRDSPPGLKNTKATICFANSMLQALSFDDTFATEVGEVVKVAYRESKGTVESRDALRKLRDILRRLATIPSYKHLLDAEPVVSTFMDTSQEQDAHEFLTAMMHLIDGHRAKAAAPSPKCSFAGVLGTPEMDPVRTAPLPSLTGACTTSYTCINCGGRAPFSISRFNSLLLPIPVPSDAQGTGANVLPSCTLESCLDDFFKEEVIDGVACMKCGAVKLLPLMTERMMANLASDDYMAGAEFTKGVDALQTFIHATNVGAASTGKIFEGVQVPLRPMPSRATKTTHLTALPQTLMLHINRVAMLRGQARKLRNKVIYPDKLDMGAYVGMPDGKDAPTGAVEGPDGVVMATENDIARYTRPEVWYNLKAVVCHAGNEAGGHYYTYRVSAGRVFKCSDRDVTEVSVDEMYTARAFQMAVTLVYGRSG
ncbi:Ubiquitin carboxyl-terminal hydrolase [Carpediemonas membranifera]|uniref:ubiquitinyl hydrolase 1 n=1 Tax=Carpediemonas membranifera TaxID=201153 RepID=A0A8J6AY16_9EUKA|nr:Ubiquitin carboxyl-terminal hydrolase [Carpediemonas membranifera]|eukprot:KAG9396913.1 Ubiquitin carboxyl-terminal hydrolase [Carpediemonas membranifera]